MSKFLTSDRSGAIPINPVRAAALPAFLDRHPRYREWLSRTGFKAEPGTFAFLPGGDGRPEAIVASPAEGAPVYAFAGLPMALPEGRYVLEAGNHDASPTDVALGWTLGGYEFTAYKESKRAPATLVWPANADGAWCVTVMSPFGNGPRGLIFHPTTVMLPEPSFLARVSFCRSAMLPSP